MKDIFVETTIDSMDGNIRKLLTYLACEKTEGAHSYYFYY